MPSGPYTPNQKSGAPPLADAGGFSDHQATAERSISAPVTPAVGAQNTSQLGSDVPIAHGGFVQAISVGVTISQAGKYLTSVSALLIIALGATAPSALQLSGTVAGAGSVIFTVPPSQLVNNAVLTVPFFMSGAGTYAAGGSDSPEISVNATGQDVTVKSGSYMQGMMVPSS